jgi:hypothetical protein
VIDIDVQIEGVSERAAADAIRQRVRRVLQPIAQPGEWRITVSPSETRGQWDLGMRAPSGWHFAWFTEAIESLPDLIERKLREFLELDRHLLRN